MHMHGEFDDIMSFKGDTLTVCGPIFWNGTTPTDLPATQLTLLSLVIAQPGRTPAVATPGDVFTPAQPDPNEWMSSIRGDWVPGPASALALVQVKISGRARQWIFETWSMTIALVADA
jgi:hypothetical protein